uniref:Mab-21 like 4 n=1 Tax=Latimeria chalumnae TaxID=7897 RepID=H3A739_LATCH
DNFVPQHFLLAMDLGPSASWQRYLRSIKSLQHQRIQDLQAAENIVYVILERVNAQDCRFLVDFSRDHVMFEYTMRTFMEEMDMEVPLWVDSSGLVLEEDSEVRYQLDGVPHKQPLGKEYCYLGLPKEEGDFKKWSTEDVFHTIPSSKCKGHVVPGRVLERLKQLVIGAIVYCQQSAMIMPGDVSAVQLNGKGSQIPLKVRCGFRMIQVNIIPVVKRVVGPLKVDRGQSGVHFPKRILEQVTAEGIDIMAATYYHWRYSYCRPVWKFLDSLGNLDGHRLESLCLLDRVNLDNWCSADKKGGLTFLHLQTALLWAVEFFPSLEDWSMLELSAYRVLVVLLRCLATQNLPSFFQPQLNLFQGEELSLKALFLKVLEFTDCPEQFLQIHITHLLPKQHHRVDEDVMMLLRMADPEGTYWNTAYFDVLLQKLQVFHSKDSGRIAAMEAVLSKATRQEKNE